MNFARSSELEGETAMLPQDPPPLVVRSIGWLIIALFGCALAGAMLIDIPETVRCRFELLPESGADPVQAPYAALIDSVAVTEMQDVKAGEALFVLKSDEFRRRDTQLHTLTKDQRTLRDGIEKINAAHQVELTIFDEQQKQIEEEIAFLETFIEANREFRDTLAGLQAQGAISRLKLDQQVLEVSEAEKDRHVARRALEQTRLARHKATVDHSRRIDESLAEIAKFEQQITALREDVINADGNLLTVSAPYDAVVISLARRNSGGVVEPGDVLCHLARRDAVATARLTVDEEGVSQLSPGHSARLFFDAFPYQRYGTVSACIDWVSPAAVTVDSQRIFTASAHLNQLSIDAHGKTNLLRMGMKGEARAVVGRRTLIEYAFEPVRQLRENMRTE